MKNKEKNTVYGMVDQMLKSGEPPHFVIGYLSSMIDNQIRYKEYYVTLQESIDNGVEYVNKKTLVKPQFDSEMASTILANAGKE
jgi:hypothetical protein